MRVRRQEQTAAVVADVVVLERGVVVSDQQAILIREVFNSVAQGGIVVEIAHTTGAGRLREQQIFVAGFVEVRRPDGRVVHTAR